MSHRKLQCPNCQASRQKNPNDKPLYVDSETGAAKCYHCEWTGKVDRSGNIVTANWRRSQKRYAKPDYVAVESDNEKLIRWFENRAIPATIVKRNRIELRQAMMPQTGNREWVICFPYFRGGEVVNVKYRTKEKQFRMEANAELTLYGLDDIDPAKPLIICEGEIDKLSFEAAGYRSCVSVPNGAGTNLDILADAEKYLAPIKKIIIAGDNDEPGQRLSQEIIRRIGAERCYRVNYPTECKDANDVLTLYGVDGLREVIEYATPVPIEGVFQISDVLEDLLEIYRNGRPQGEQPGWNNLQEFYRPRLGTWTVITGTPNSGKSSFLRALIVNLAIKSDWRFLVFPPEDCPPAEYFSLLCELLTGLPFDKGRTERMTEADILNAADWIQDRFIVMNPPESQCSFQNLLDLTRSCITRNGINAVVIDPYNRIENHRPANTTETEFIGQTLSAFDRFVKNYQLHGFFVAHPTKLSKDKDGVYPVATLYDISGSSHWHNMSDFGLSIWRNKADDNEPVQVHVQKVRHRWCGRLGMANLYYDRVTGRYDEIPTTNEYGGR